MRLKNHLLVMISILMKIPLYFYSVYRLQDIANEFLKMDNVEIVYAEFISTDIHLNIVVKDEEMDDLGLKLAKIQNHLMRKYKWVYIELDYYSKANYTTDNRRTIYKFSR